MSDCACIAVPPEAEEAGRLLFFLELTPACNNACPGCSNVFAHDRFPGPLSAREWSTVLDRIAPNAFYLELTGGEPTLHPEFEEIIEHIQGLGIPFNLFTNARWPEPERLVSFLAGAQPNRLLVSLHGISPPSHEAFTGVPGSFVETLDNIRRAIEAGLTVTTSTVLTQYNCTEVEAMVDLGQELDAHHAAFQRYIGAAMPELEPDEDGFRGAVAAIERIRSNGGNHKASDELARFGTPIPHCFAANSSNGCRAGEVQITVDPWGNVRPCNHVPVVCGNLLSQSLDEIMHSAAMESWRRLIPDECLGCLDFEVCRGGCRATAMLRELRQDPLIRMAVPRMIT